MDYSYIRYLSSKKTIDDRALNKNLWNRLFTILHTQNYKRQLKVLEVGAGIGTMIERIFEWRLLDTAIYTAIDIDETNLKEAYSRLLRWARKHSFQFIDYKKNDFILRSHNQSIRVKLEASDFFNYYYSIDPGHYDLILSHAFLDLINLEKTIPKLLSLLKKDGLFYFTHNFNGVTIFKPIIDKTFDSQVISNYHKTMDNRRINGEISGGSKTGENLHQLLKILKTEIIDFGNSNWQVSPTNNQYIEDEAYFLHYIIHTIEKALTGHPNIDSIQSKKWIQTRHEQIRKAKLHYTAHQIDFLGRTTHLLTDK